ncbi:tripartite tricarboxylate transporter substrate binding protein [Comamonadaceae bacterium OH2545_COT-014]|nr:tripartite tricarboxylate transporter substrate binding protein [Comamonadaceae bacterium OH2545_COT-014]
MMMQRRPFLLAALAAAAGAAPALHAQGPAPAAAWPTRPVKLVVGFPGGSSPDLTARTLAEPLSRALGQPVIVENKPGAGGNIAADQVAKATDDHTLGIVINGNLTSAPMLYAKLPYKPSRDFTYLSLLTTAPVVLAAPASEPGGAAFFEKAAKMGDQWNYGSVGAGSIAHLGMELLKARVLGLQAVHVPYNGMPAVVTGLIGGQVQMALIAPGVAMPQVQAGKLQAIGLSSTGRSALVPGVPPLADLGVKDFSFEVWNALVGPASLSAPARQTIVKVLGTVMRTPEVRQRLLAQGWQPVGTSPEGLEQRVAQETKLLGGIIRSRGIRLD